MPPEKKTNIASLLSKLTKNNIIIIYYLIYISFPI